MLSGIVISRDASLNDGIQRMATNSRQVLILRMLESYPEPHEIQRIVNACDPDVVFIDVGEWYQAAPCVTRIRAKSPKTAVIGFGSGSLAGREAHFLEAGAAEVLLTPFDLEQFRDAVQRAFRTVRSGVLPPLVAILPAKAGNGSSLTAFNLAGALVAAKAGRVLLIDGDLRSGILATRAGATPELTLRDVLQDPTLLSHSQWLRCITPDHGFDLLAAGDPVAQCQPNWSNYYHLLQYATSEYPHVIIDMAETTSDASSEVLLRAARVLILCTPEGPSLKLARRRCREVSEMGVPPDRISLLVNRWHETDPLFDEITDEVGAPVLYAIPNNYQVVRDATDTESLVSPETNVGAAYRAIAHIILGVPAEPEIPGAEEEKKPKSRLAALLGR